MIYEMFKKYVYFIIIMNFLYFIYLFYANTNNDFLLNIYGIELLSI